MTAPENPAAAGLAGRTAVITGASRGIGLAIARQLVAEGANVVLTGRKQDALNAARAELSDRGQVIAVAGKVDDPEHQEACFELAEHEFGPVTLLVNNVGLNPVFGPLMELDLPAARKVVEVNVLSALAWIQLAYRRGMQRHGGSIVNVSSVAGLRPAPGIGMYGASKAMLLHLTRELAVELAPDVRVNAVAPAVVKTRFAAALYEEKEDELAATYPLRRLGEPLDVARAVRFLLSAESSWITGQTVVIDGGATLLHAESSG
jgi:3-oxoacyl-[acyl-carrier protein] reductase